MKLAVLGTDSEIIQLALAAKSAGHEIAWLGDLRPADEAHFRPFAPTVATSGDWELLLDQATADAVLVGRGTASAELREEQLKRLVAASVPLLVVHPTGHSVLTYYELDMTRRESHDTLRHFNPLISHPIIPTLAAWVEKGHETIGTIQQIACQREVSSKSRIDVLHWLSRDAELLAAIAGNIRHVSGVGPRDTAASYSSLQVQLTTPRLSSLRWSVVPSSGASQGELQFVGEHGTIIVRIPADPADEQRASWQVDTVVAGQHRQESLQPFDAPRLAIEQLAAAVADSDTERRAAASTWPAATQSMEVVDAVELSLQKGRTIEVHQQQLTEQLAFRGTMAALGCGLLLVGFAVVILAGLVGIFESRERDRLIPQWPLLLLAALAFFLLLQIVPLLATKRKVTKSPRGPTSKEAV